ncbi:MAG TPA: peroxiredoxin [Opitutaceae bacterium]|nr:peroxiredoxin [Opitutaceae bacterium]
MKRSLLLLAMSFSFFGLWASAEPLDIGADAPKITATNQDGATVDLGELYKKGLVLVYFYPKADTGGCTAQACSLRDEFEVLSDKGVTVVGVSTDNAADQKAFQEKYNLPFTLIADTDKKVVDAFGVPRMGSMASRQAYLVKGGKIVWRDLKASTKEQATDVLAAIETLGD